MQQIHYEGEHLLIGNLGHFFVVLAVVAAIASGLLYLIGREHAINKKLARAGFIIHALSVFGIFISLFIIIQNHYFEYQYAYQHSSLQLPMKYLVSCFWEGQEGSFLLWMVWNSILGIILIPTAGKWENGVMPIVALSQVVLGSMLLGVEFGDFYVLGRSPFDLLRVQMFDKAPIFVRPDYLTFIKDGTGLNPLLQNYWMVIHPPTLFLGFALTLVPFAFAVTGIFRSDHRGWIKPALPWALVGGMILGTGIIMGGFWAYESLSFGGYWAWDPVENASLVPWLMLIAGIHLMLIKKTTNSATIASYLLILGTFVLVLYATFLTRSGVLGETSVHAFTDLDLSGQLMQFVVIFIWLPIVGVTRKLRDKLLISALVLILILLLPFQEKFAFYSLLFMSLSGLAWFGLSLNRELASSKQGDDNIWSREFWMFIGSLIITVAAVQIMFTTSIPVFNKIFGTNAAPPTDPIAHYNKYQLPFAIVITILVSIGQYFQYRNTVDKRKFKANILYLAIASIIVTILEVILFQLRTPFYMVFLLTCTYAILANLNYLINQLKGKILYSGASIAHVGFGLMLVGILVSSANKRIITKDLDGSMQGFDQRYRMENMRLWQDEPTRLGDFWVTYLGDSTEGPNTYFMVNYTSLDSTEVFTLYPNAQISERDGMMANPDTRHYITYDVYTHVTSIPNPNDSIEWSNVREYEIELGDTISTANGDIVFNAVEEAKLEQDLKNASVYQAHLSVFSSRGIDEVYPKYIIVDRSNFGIREEVPEIGLRFLFEIRVDSIGPKAILEVAETEPRPRFIVMKAIIFPYINLLWLGTIVMVLGFGIAAFQHIRK